MTLHKSDANQKKIRKKTAEQRIVEALKALEGIKRILLEVLAMK